MAVLIGAGLLVAALVVWALTRTVEPTSVMSTASTADATTTFTPPPAGTTAAPVPAPTTATSTAGAFQTTPPVTASMPAPTPAPHPEGNRAEVKRISAEDLRAQLGRGDVTVIDVRQSADYARGHVAGAINIPFASIETQFDSIPKNKPIVTYCT